MQQLHNLLYSIDYTVPVDDRHTEEQTANKILMCMSVFDTFFRGKCHAIINGEPGQCGLCERGTPILALDADGVATPTGDYTYSLSLQDVLTYFGKLWETGRPASSRATCPSPARPTTSRAAPRTRPTLLLPVLGALLPALDALSPSMPSPRAPSR